MRIKSFYAGTVEEALALARRDFGPDAMLVQSRKAPVEARHLGQYEVVCATLSEGEASAEPPAAGTTPPPDSRLALELSELRRKLDAMVKTISRSAWSGTQRMNAHPALSEFQSRLLAADLDGELVNEILSALQQPSAASSGSNDAMEHLLLAEIEKRIPVDPTLSASAGSEPSITALVGPSGAGKTVTLAKLAVVRGLAVRRPVVFLSIDDYRVGGAEQLRSYAMILGAKFQALDTIPALAQALEEPQGKALILIDTPGYGPRDIDRAAGLARFLSTRSDISTHLVLTASMKSADLSQVIERYAIFRPGRLLFTRLDETDTFGTAVSAAIRHGKPLSFLGTGQEIPDDLEPATRERVMSLLWPQPRWASQSAA